VDFSRNTYSHDDNRSAGGLLRIFDFAMLLVTMVAAVLLVCAYAARWVHPADAWFFAFAGLAAPILYVANIVLALYWVVRWKRRALIPLVVLLIGAGWISLFFKPTLRKTYHEPDRRRSSVIMSYNVAGFLTESGDELTSTLDSIAAFITRTRPDILCLQEFQSITADQKPRIDSLLGMPYNRVNYKITNSAGGGWGLAVYSNYRIVGSGVVDFENTTNSAQWVDVLLRPGDTVRVFNCHLQTTSLDRSDREYIMNQEFLANDGEVSREERVRSIVGKLRRNFIVRAAQADSLAPLIHAATPVRRVVVCGDFNDTPMSYVYRTMRGRLADTFVERGTGAPSTYQGMFNLFRIDYILHSRDIETLGYSSPAGISYSDHKPVIATVRF